MAKKRTKPSSDSPDGLTLDILKVQESHKTYRWISGCVAFMVVAWAIAHTVVEVAGQPLSVVKWIVWTASVAIGAWTAPPLAWVVRLRFYMKRDHERLKDLEQRCDPGRETSGIRNDGTNPDDHP